MKTVLIIVIASLSILVVGYLKYTQTPTIEQGMKQSSEISHEEYTVDSSDFYSVDQIKTISDSEKLTQNEEKWLIRMREEEKLARDVYTTLGEKWQMNIFTNIANSEQTHTDSVKTLLKRYAIEDSVKNNAVGEFTLPEIKEIYDDLVIKGSKSLSDAFIVGATIEDLDIFDLDVAMSETAKADINTVYANLQKGSRNHMRAFVKQINNQGSTYVPKYISEEVFNNIISSSQERGRK